MSRLVLTSALAVLLWACSMSGTKDASSVLERSAEISDISIEVGDLVFDARVAGPPQGDPVLLLHGFAETSWEFRHQLKALGEAGYYAVAPDQRGYSPGARPLAVDAYRMELLVGDVLGIADALGFDRFHLVGHDWGSLVSWYVAGAARERILTLNTISAPHPDALAQELDDYDSCTYASAEYIDYTVIGNFERTVLANNERLLRENLNGMPEADIDVHIETLRKEGTLSAAVKWYKANYDGRDGFLLLRAGKIQVPTMFVWSEDRFGCRDVAELTEQFVGAPYRFEVIEGVNHWIPENAPEALSHLLLDHIGGRLGRD